MKTIPEIPYDAVVLLNISRCYNATEQEEDIYKRPNIYEMTRKFWKIDKDHAEQAKYACGVANGVIVSVYSNLKWSYVDYNGCMRCAFEGDSVDKSPLLGLNVSQYVRSQNPITYVNC